MTFDKIPPPPPPQAMALWSLWAAMTQWEALDQRAASARVQAVGRRLDLSAQMGAAPPFPEPPPRSEIFVGALDGLREAPHATRMLALQGALEVALGSGTLPLAQNHALRMVAEALHLEPGDLATLMFERTGAELPAPWDPSRPVEWRGREAGGFGPAGSWDDAGHPLPAAPMGGDRIVRIKALALLGLDEDAREGDIKRAFHRISRVHHPDHYASLGPEAAQEADQAFRRIKAAYEFLVKAGA